jgi:hypothetical protein
MNKQILERYFKGQCTAEEELLVIQWLQSENFEKELGDYIADDLRQSFNIKTGQINQLAHIPLKITKESRSQSNRKDRKYNIVNRMIKVAASIIFLSIIGYAIYNFIYPINNSNNGENAIHSEKVSRINERGQKSKIYLTDGSIIYLNSE